MNCLKLVVIVVLTTLWLGGCNESANNGNHPQGVGPNWDSLYQLDNVGSDTSLKVKLKKSYLLGDEIRLAVTSAKAGKLWIVYVDSNDEVSMLFPNEFDKDNNIQARQTLEIPTNDDWAAEAIEPVGRSLIGFILTTGDTSFKEVFFQSSPEQVSKALRLLDSTPSWVIKKHIIEVTEKQ